MSSFPNLGMPLEMQQERFGDTFLLAAASVAGCAAVKPEPDNDSIDWTLSCRLQRRPKIDVQMKTVLLDDENLEIIPYPLKRKNYDDLILTDILVPRILVLVTLPTDIAEWLVLSPRELLLRRCAYWKSLAGFPASDNQISVTVHVSTGQPFSVEQLCQMMQKLSQGSAL
jgi:hypothetical protein